MTPTKRAGVTPTKQGGVKIKNYFLNYLFYLLSQQQFIL